MIDGLTRSGIHVFMNEGLTLSVGRQPLYLAGVDDGWVRRHDLEQALAYRNGEDPTLLLMHEPDFADDFLADGRVLLQLSGHSHGGQVRFPFIRAPPSCPRSGASTTRACTASARGGSTPTWASA